MPPITAEMEVVEGQATNTPAAMEVPVATVRCRASSPANPVAAAMRAEVKILGVPTMLAMAATNGVTSAATAVAIPHGPCAAGSSVPSAAGWDAAKSIGASGSVIRPTAVTRAIIMVTGSAPKVVEGNPA